MKYGEVFCFMRPQFARNFADVAFLSLLKEKNFFIKLYFHLIFLSALVSIRHLRRIDIPTRFRLSEFQEWADCICSMQQHSG